MSRYRGIGDAKVDVTSVINKILESKGKPIDFT